VLFLDSGKCIKQLHERRRGRSLARRSNFNLVIQCNVATITAVFLFSTLSGRYAHAHSLARRSECVRSMHSKATFSRLAQRWLATRTALFATSRHAFFFAFHFKFGPLKRVAGSMWPPSFFSAGRQSPTLHACELIACDANCIFLPLRLNRRAIFSVGKAIERVDF
jgi:hypothetical protein